jgi:lipopolysaccharide export system permease protein
MSPLTPFAAAGVVTVLASLAAAYIAFVAGPEGARRSFDIRAEGLRTALVRGLAPGQFRSLDDRAVLYFRELDAQGTLHEVFFQRRLAGDDAAIEIIVADKAHYQLAADGSLAAVVLEQGSRYEGVPGQGAWRTMQFREQTVPVPAPPESSSAPRPDMQSTAALRDSADARFRGEFHWRIATVVITVLLGVLAVPLSRLQPRQGRYGRIIHVVLFYAVYVNLLIWGRALFDKGGVPDWAGLWWVHAVMVVLSLLLLRRR